MKRRIIQKGRQPRKDQLTTDFRQHFFSIEKIVPISNLTAKVVDIAAFLVNTACLILDLILILPSAIILISLLHEYSHFVPYLLSSLSLLICQKNFRKIAKNIFGADNALIRSKIYLYVFTVQPALFGIDSAMSWYLRRLTGYQEKY